MSVKTRIINKHAVEADWQKATNFKPLQGEIIIYDPDTTHTEPRVKIGDGVNYVNDLPFLVKEEDPQFIVYHTTLTTTSSVHDNINIFSNSAVYNITSTTKEKILYIILGSDLTFHGQSITLALNGNTNTTLNSIYWYTPNGFPNTIATISDGSGFNVGQALQLCVKGSGIAGQFEYVRLLNLPYPAAENASF